MLQTNACSPLATNAIDGNIWDNFSSQTYKDLPSAGSITWYQPYTGEARTMQLPAGGRGYTRPASRISAWSTAPFLLNNSVGIFNPSPSVEARMASFQDSIEKMLWPEKRDKDSLLGDKVPGRSIAPQQPATCAFLQAISPTTSSRSSVLDTGFSRRSSAKGDLRLARSPKVRPLICCQTWICSANRLIQPAS